MIRSEVRERVAIITIDNPPVNALPVRAGSNSPTRSARWVAIPTFAS